MKKIIGIILIIIGSLFSILWITSFIILTGEEGFEVYSLIAAMIFLAISVAVGILGLWLFRKKKVKKLNNISHDKPYVKPEKIQHSNTKTKEPITNPEISVSYPNKTIERNDPKYDFIAIDFETANNNMDSACSLGLAFVLNNELVNTKEYLIKPYKNIFSKTNIDIHGITAQDVENKPLFPEVWNEIKGYFNNNIIVGHNVHFDMSVLHQCLTAYSLELPDFNYADTITLSNMVCPGGDLSKRAEFFGIEQKHIHNAEDDARVAAEILIGTIMMTECKLNELCQDDLKPFSKLNPIKTLKNKSAKSNVKISELKPNNNVLNADHPLFGKTCVVTGEFSSMSRNEVMQSITDAGGIVRSGVSGKTQYLFVGEQDMDIVGADGMSNKEEKAYDLIEKGKDIKIMGEKELLEYLK